jgi:hypothetical protein
MSTSEFDCISGGVNVARLLAGHVRDADITERARYNGLLAHYSDQYGVPQATLHAAAWQLIAPFRRSDLER